MKPSSYRRPSLGRQRPQIKAPARVVSLPAPYGGWNARDALTAMPITDAIELENFIPDVGGVRLRGGYIIYSVASGSVESLMTYSPPDGNEELFAASGTSIYDATVFESVAPSVLTGLSNAQWQYVMMATTGGNFLVICNGQDSVRNYDGTTWTTPAITGGTSSTFINVAVHFSRLWFVQKDTLDAWYLPVASIAGAATKFPLGQLCKLGGYLVAIASWSRDGGAGMDDLLVFLTSKGEALVYSGTDPDDAATWNKVGTYNIPEPIGRRCVVNIGSDIGVITSQGVLPFSAIVPLPISAQGKVAATEKIATAFTEAYNGSADLFGWQVIEYPRERLAIVNVPITELGTSQQFVMNTQTGAWCKWTGLNANCWAIMGGHLYFGKGEAVWKYGDGVFSDESATEFLPINATAISAYTDLGGPQTKVVKMARAMITAIAGYLPGVAIRTEFDTGLINYSTASSESGGELWDDAEWDVAEWAPGIINSSRWQSVTGNGSRVSFALNASTSDQFRFDAVDLMVEDGGYL